MSVSYQPEIWDTRNENSSSVSILPLLDKDDWPALKAYMQSHWPDFDIVGNHGEERAKPGERWWGIGAIEVKEGEALFQVQFRKDANTYDYGNILSFQWFGSAPALDSSFDVRYYDNGNWAFSEGSGDNGWPYGAAGPYSFWVNSDPTDWPDRRVGSDCMDHVYWFDSHVSLNPVFWPMRKGDSTPPPTTNARLVNLDQAGNIVGYINFLSGAGQNALGLEVNGKVYAHIPWEPIE